MGCSKTGAVYSSYDRYRLGWLPKYTIKELGGTLSKTTFTLYPTDAESGWDKLQAIVAKQSIGKDRSLWIEYHNHISYSSVLVRLATDDPSSDNLSTYLIDFKTSTSTALDAGLAVDTTMTATNPDDGVNDLNVKVIGEVQCPGVSRLTCMEVEVTWEKHKEEDTDSASMASLNIICFILALVITLTHIL
eukprot:TRINITY_DN2192_c0_g5_i2.p1 TRINITY_DN2192_c0_g5~~TRINITY_DN2192_c0_g5_i2.p1  ORF type:complete len:218 (+),score=21.07 TRINITY_DN2192_c0_g5_i2:87-656(+)